MKQIRPVMLIPSTGDGYDNSTNNQGDNNGTGVGAGGDVEDSFKPLSRAELQNRVMDGVKKKEMEANHQREVAYRTFNYHILILNKYNYKNLLFF